MTRLLYSAAYLMALPLLFPGQYRKRPAEARKLWLSQKLGKLKFRDSDAPLVWIHAVSVGEVAASVTFINAFLERHPGYEVVVSTITDTGRKVALDKLKGRAEVIYLPFDLPRFIRRAIKALRPSVFLVMETELWPNLFHCMKSENVPVALLNGRISEKSYNSYRRLGLALAPVLSCVDLFSMQDSIYASRIIGMGAEPRRVHVSGSFKFDLRPARTVIQWAQGLRRPVVVAGSTHRGEEELMARIFKDMLSRRDASLVIVPRHPERAPEVGAVLSSHGLRFRLRSSIEGKQSPDDIDVILVDTVGELTSIYSEADVVVMGGSFIPHGGQNPLEPAYWGKPVICGPHMENFPFVGDFYDKGAALMADEATLMGTIESLLDSVDMRNEIGKRAQEMVSERRGAVMRAVELVEGLMGSVR